VELRREGHRAICPWASICETQANLAEIYATEVTQDPDQEGHRRGLADAEAWLNRPGGRLPDVYQCTRPAAGDRRHRYRRGRNRDLLAGYLGSLGPPGLVGVQLAIPDAHLGIKAVLAQVLGAPWQRCSAHFLKDCLGHACKDQHGSWER